MTGVSMGGFGTFDILCHAPDLFAAALPVSGGGNLIPECKGIWADIPIWAVTGSGAKDLLVNPDNSRQIFDVLDAMGSENMRLTQLQTDHLGSWQEVYKPGKLKTMDWLFSQRK